MIKMSMRDYDMVDGRPRNASLIERFATAMRARTTSVFEVPKVVRPIVCTFLVTRCVTNQAGPGSITKIAYLAEPEVKQDTLCLTFRLRPLDDWYTRYK